MTSELTIHRGTHNIGGCCTELTVGGERLLIDLGASLPECDCPISDDALLKKVFDGRPADALLFTHPHGDHYGLYKKVPPEVPMYIGPMAKEILKVLAARLDCISEEKGLPVIERMGVYRYGKELKILQNFRILPLYVDHSAPDAYMFYIQTAGKRILFTGDFREHGIVGERGRLWRVLEKYVPRGIDLLITEGTMLSSAGKSSSPHTEEELGQRAAELFRRHKYNFVLVSSTNLDSIMEFYHNTPPGMRFVCDSYQAEVMLTAMGEMEKKGTYPMYQCAPNHPRIHVLGESTAPWWARLRQLGAALQKPVSPAPVTGGQLYHDGFVMLCRKNSGPGQQNVFERMRNSFCPKGGQIIYSMWDSYIDRDSKHADPALLKFIGPYVPEHLHSSGHAYVETIAKLIETTDPRRIIPMHTEKADEFTSIPAFAPWKGRVKVLVDGEQLPLDKL